MRGMASRILLTVLTCCLSLPARAADPKRLDLFEAETGGYATYRIPGVVVTKQGTILAYCEARKSAKSDWGAIDVMMRRSTDGSATFEAPREMVEAPPIDPDPSGKQVGITINNPVAI